MDALSATPNLVLYRRRKRPNRDKKITRLETRRIADKPAKLKS
jgi:hypothetical protein